MNSMRLIFHQFQKYMQFKGLYDYLQSHVPSESNLIRAISLKGSSDLLISTKKEKAVREIAQTPLFFLNHL